MTSDLSNRPSRRHQYWVAAMWTAGVAGVFLAVVLALLVLVYVRRVAKDPLNSETFQNLKNDLADLRSRPASESVQGEIDKTIDEIRTEDSRLRQEYFWERNFAAHGAWLLLGGMTVFLIAVKCASTLRRKLPMPATGESTDDPEATRTWAGRLSVVGLGVLVVAAMLALTLGVHSELPATWSQTSALSSQSSAISPDNSALSTQHSALSTRPVPSGTWPAFRGSQGSGISPWNNVPTRWDVKTGEKIIWKSPIPLDGNSSPVVWNDRLFLTGATADKRQVLCYDTATGQLLWQRDVSGTPAPDLKVDEKTGYASPTPATDGHRVYAIFATGDLAAFDMAGTVVWTRSLGIPKSQYGHASSLRIHKELLIVQYDQGTKEEGLSRLLALDTATGKTIWETKRPVPNSWSTPIIIEVNPSPQPPSPVAEERGRGEGAGQEQIITCGDPWVIAYAVADGKEIWRAKCLLQDVGPSPVFANGVVYAAVEYQAASAIRADGKGDVTKTHILWSVKEDVPDLCSPLIDGPYFLFLTTFGAKLTCCEAATGKKLWDLEIDGEFRASPSLVGNNVYLFGAEGKAYILEPGPDAAKTIFTTEMGDNISASPAFQDGRIYVRGQKQLFCIGEK